MIAFTSSCALSLGKIKFQRQACCSHSKGFTLVEMLMVISLMGILSALVATAISGIKESGNFNESISQISGELEQARAYAIAKNTFVYVGFTEVDASQSSTAGTPAPGNGRIVVVAMASKDGTRGFDLNNSDPASSWSSNYNSGSNLMLITKPLYVNGVHLPSQQEPSTNNMSRPALSSVANDLISGSVQTDTPLTFPLGSSLGSGQYNFTRVIYFDPEGAAHVQLASTTDGSLDPYLEIDLQPSHGDLVAATTTGNLAAIQIDGMTGSLHVYRP